MLLREFQCDGFRLLSEIDFRPGPGLTVVVGDNAQGKTSLLEALLYVATSKSHRTNTESELVQHGKEGLRLRALVQRTDRPVELSAALWQGAKRFKVNGVPQTRLSDILGKVNLVFFSPEDVALVRGSSVERRLFMDMGLSQLRAVYLHALQSYRQALRQRNELLRKPHVDPGLLAVWDRQLADFADPLIRQRREFVAELAQASEAAYARIAPGEALKLEYAPSVDSGDGLLAALEKTREADLRAGHTTKGPHRDDLRIRIEGDAARTFGSQGQQRTAALAIKLAELDVVKRHIGEYPILMLDDVLSELDASRSRRLFEAIAPEVQCLLTTTDLSAHRSLFSEATAFVRIEQGRLAHD